jgi:hypothetical protein
MPADGLSAGYVCPPLPPEELSQSRRCDSLTFWLLRHPLKLFCV